MKRETDDVDLAVFVRMIYASLDASATPTNQERRLKVLEISRD